jgi:hypothetical protein
MKLISLCVLLFICLSADSEAHSKRFQPWSRNSDPARMLSSFEKKFTLVLENFGPVIIGHIFREVSTTVGMPLNLPDSI